MPHAQLQSLLPAAALALCTMPQAHMGLSGRDEAKCVAANGVLTVSQMRLHPISVAYLRGPIQLVRAMCNIFPPSKERIGLSHKQRSNDTKMRMKFHYDVIWGCYVII